MSVRAEQKQRTRQNIIDAALKILNEDKGLSSLSLREVAKEAGIAPTSFYRHFQSLDEVGLVLIKDAVDALHTILQDAISAPRDAKQDTLPAIVAVVMDHFRAHGALFRVLAREATGSSRTLRRAIKKEMDAINHELADLIDAENRANHRIITDSQWVAEAISTIVFYMGVSTVGMPYAMQKEAERKLVHHIRAIYTGAETMARTTQMERQLMLS
jgi:AcrR family transcriptional regulator